MRNVLLAIDGSSASEQAARFFAHLPHSDQLELTIISVVQYPYIHSGYAMGDLLEVAYERDRTIAFENYKKIAALFDGANVKIHHMLKDGNVGDAIVETAEEIKADLVVIGATGKSQLSRVLLGSISDYVATHAHCSVLVVRTTDPAKSDPSLQVCLAYDGNKPAQAALDEIVEIPWNAGSQFHVLMMVQYLYDLFGESNPDDSLETRCQTNLQCASDQLDDVVGRVETHLVEKEHIGEGIVDFSEVNDMDLIVVGETPRNVISQLLIGSTTRYVLRYAPCSVWITRNRVVRDDAGRGPNNEATKDEPEARYSGDIS